MDRMFAAMSRTCVQKLLSEIINHYEFDPELLTHCMTRLAQILSEGSALSPHVLTLTHALMADGTSSTNYKRENLIRKKLGCAAESIVQLLWTSVLHQTDQDRRLLLLAALTASLQVISKIRNVLLRVV